MGTLITLTTDFGTRDGYAGAMKGVILREQPQASIVDITHDVAPQDVAAGALALAQAAAYFPEGTLHVGVVDPGVGSGRRAVVVELLDRPLADGAVDDAADGPRVIARFIGPDNGLFSLAAPPSNGRVRAWVIDQIPIGWSVQPTFHGRDLFARIAARIAAGDPVEKFSSGLVDPQQLEIPVPERANGDLMGEVIHVDRFGNLVTNIPGTSLSNGHGPTVVEIAGTKATSARTFTDVKVGRLLAYVGSAGYVEVGVREGSAAALLSAARGTRLRLRHVNQDRPEAAAQR